MRPGHSSTVSDLFDRDKIAWLDAMTALLRRGTRDELDFAHLEEYLTEIAARERRQVETQLMSLLVHVLKWGHLADYQSRGWKETIIQQREELARLVCNDSLHSHAESTLPSVYAEAVERTVAESGLSVETLPIECPFTLNDLLRFDAAFE